MSPAAGLLRDERGATLVEFALIAPVLLMLLLGMFEMGYNYYMQSQLQGAVQKAARDSSVEARSGQHGGDRRAGSRGGPRHRAAAPTSTFSRRAYSSFSDVHRAEDFTDIDKNGTCNDGEPFEDANGNGQWDEDRGVGGGGGARDAVLYVVRSAIRARSERRRSSGCPASSPPRPSPCCATSRGTHRQSAAGLGNCP